MTDYPDWLREAARKGGRSTSEAKVAAARANGSAPCREGKRRGRPRKAQDGA